MNTKIRLKITHVCWL